MLHRKYEKLIVFSVYEELSEEEKRVLDAHLVACDKCREFSERVSKMRMQVAAFHREKELDQTLLDARKELRREIARSAGTIVRLAEKPRRGLAAVPRFAFAAVAVAMFAIGAVSGYLYVNHVKGEEQSGLAVLSGLTSRDMSNVSIDDVRFVSSDPRSGELSFTFDIVRHYEVKGSLDNRDIQKVLAYALVNSDNPGIRLKTIGMLDAAAARPDNEIKEALIKAVRSDDNAGVRREALLSLKKMPFDNEIKDALLFVLQKDQNPGLRIAAINFLSEKELSVGATSKNAAKIDPKVLDVLKEKSTSDQNKYVRMKATDMLKEYREL